MKKVTALKSNAARGIVANSQYVVERETDANYFLKGHTTPFAKSNFVEEGFVPKTTKNTFVKCNTRNSYKNITVGKAYVLTDTQKEGKTTYYVIVNDANQSARYNCKFFTSPYSDSEKETKKPEAPKIPKGMCLCVEEVMGLKKGELYKIIELNNNTVVIQTPDKQNGSFLKKRFQFGE